MNKKQAAYWNMVRGFQAAQLSAMQAAKKHEDEMKTKSAAKKSKRNKNTRNVTVYAATGPRFFTSLHDAAAYIGVGDSGLYKSLTDGRTCKGLKVEYGDPDARKVAVSNAKAVDEARTAARRAKERDAERARAVAATAKPSKNGATNGNAQRIIDDVHAVVRAANGSTTKLFSARTLHGGAIVVEPSPSIKPFVDRAIVFPSKDAVPDDLLALCSWT